MSNFIQPAIGNTVTIEVANTSWMVGGLPIIHSNGGFYTVNSVVDINHAVIRNDGVNGWPAPGSTVSNIGAIIAPCGLKGGKGDDGTNGNNGALWYTGHGAPPFGIGNNGDFYLDVNNGNVYEKVGGAWVVVGNIKGAKGDKGDKGDPGTPAVPVSMSLHDANADPSLVGQNFSLPRATHLDIGSKDGGADNSPALLFNSPATWEITIPVPTGLNGSENFITNAVKKSDGVLTITVQAINLGNGLLSSLGATSPTDLDLGTQKNDTITFITDIQYASPDIQIKTRTITISNGLISDLGSDSAWATMTGGTAVDCP